MSILSRRAGSKLQGEVQGVAGSFGGLASIIGLTLGGFLYNSIGVASFLISAGVISVVFVMSFRLLTQKQMHLDLSRKRMQSLSVNGTVALIFSLCSFVVQNSEPL
jgi:MFS family permease